jgi:hypothetical protein
MMVAEDFADDAAGFPLPAVELALTALRRTAKFRPTLAEILKEIQTTTEHMALAARWLERKQIEQPPVPELPVHNPVGPERVAALLSGIQTGSQSPDVSPTSET